MTVLTDGTVVVAGYPDGVNENGSGFFHRKASCGGFEATEGDELFMPAANPPMAQEKPNTQNTDTPQSGRWHPAIEFIASFKWIILAILFPLVLYLVLLPVVRRANQGRDNTALPNWVGKATRLAVCLVAAVIIFQMLPLNFLRLFNWNAFKLGSMSKQECRFVGLWSYNREGLVYEVSLFDNGKYQSAPVVQPDGKSVVYKGDWVLVDDVMIWHHHIDNQIMIEKNPLSLEPDGSFVLTEESGFKSHFVLVKKIESNRCKSI